MPSYKTPLTLLDPDGGWLNAPVHVSELHGQPVLLHFWSMDCAPCKAQMPEVVSWLADYGPRGLRVIGVHSPIGLNASQPDVMDTNVLEARADELGLYHPVAVDDGSMARAYSVTSVPAYLLFDREGLLRHHVSGEDASQDFRRVLERIVGPSASTDVHAF